MSDDSDSSCEWSVISQEGEIENLNAVADCSDEAKNIVSECDMVPLSKEQLSDSSETMQNSLMSEDCKENAVVDDIGESDTSSDIEKIDEPMTIQTSFESSSAFSTFSDSNPLEHFSSSILLKNSDILVGSDTQSDIPLDDATLQILNSECLRSYRHTPNQRLNISLNILLGLTVTLVFGLGVGHFIGWSNQWLNQQCSPRDHLATLNLLEDELRTCLQKQQANLVDSNFINLQPCYEKADHWKQQFDKVLMNNKYFDELLSGSHKLNHCNDKDEYRKLKSDFIHKQLEHIEAVKQFERIKLEERKFRQKFKSLEDENTDLKIKLEMEEQEDNEEQMILFFIMKENVKLRLTIENLQHNIHDDIQHSMFSDHISTKTEMGTLRQHINQLQIENEDLRQVIAKLRYSQALNSKISEELQNKYNQLETENMDLKLEIGKMRYSKPPDTSESSFQDVTGIRKTEKMKHVETENGNEDASFIHYVPDQHLKNSGENIPNNEESDINDSDSKDTKIDRELLNVSNYLQWVKTHFSWFEKDYDEILGNFFNKSLAKYWKQGIDLTHEEILIIINENLINLLNFLHGKWEMVHNITAPQNQTVSNKSFFAKVLSIWEQAKMKLKNAVIHSKAKLKEKPWNKFINQMQKMISFIQNKVSGRQKRKFPKSQETNEEINSFASVTEKEFSKNSNHKKDDGKEDGKTNQWDQEKIRFSPLDGKFPEETRKERKQKKKKRHNKDSSEDEITDSGWLFKRAEYRERKKESERLADWIFDRARNRAEQRNLN